MSDFQDYGYGKIWNTRMLLGEAVIVTTRDHNLEVSGLLKEFFEKSESLAIEKYSITVRRDEGIKDIVESGDIIFMKRDSWLSIRCRELRKK